MSEFKLKLPVVKRGRRSAAATIIFNQERKAFADALKEKQKQIVTADGRIMKVSARGWCYLLETWNLITKDQFDQAQKLINDCRKTGLLPIDFVAVDKAREFDNVENLSEDYQTPKDYMRGYMTSFRHIYRWKNDIAFWESQEYYIQMMVEKIDVKSLFAGICKKYHIPISNAKGWSDLHSRNNLAQRFKEAEEMGLKPVLLYYGDFDPAGILISDILKKNLKQIEKATGWNPDNLIVDRFGLEYDFIETHGLLWIDNLMTGGGKELDNPRHPDHKKAYVQEYLTKYGVRKCEANAILPMGQIAINQCEETILKYLGEGGNDPFEKYDEKKDEIKQELKSFLKKIDYKQKIRDLAAEIENIEEVN